MPNEEKPPEVLSLGSAKPTFRSMNLTPEHLNELELLASGKSFVTKEHPSIVSHYFKRLAIEASVEAAGVDNNFSKRFKSEIGDLEMITFTDLKRGIKRDARLWRVRLAKGVSIAVTKINPRYVDKVSVNVQQHVDPTAKQPETQK